jgi:predicted Zn-dependent peptidase
MRKLLFALTNCLAALTLMAADSAPVKVRLPDYKTVTLENGITLFLMERHELPIATIRWIMPSGGSISDPVGKEGLGMLTAQMLRKGASARSANQIAEAIDFVGGTLECGASQEFAFGEAEFVKKDLDLGLELLADTLLKPSFPQVELKKMIEQEIDGITQAKEVPGTVIPLYFQRFLYGAHPFSRPAGGTETSLATITKEDLVAFYDKWYAPNQITLAVAGDFSSAAMEQAVRQRFGEWKKGPISPPPLGEPQRAVGRKALLVEKPDATQVFFRVGNISLARTNADWIPVQVVNTLFGGRFTSMLNTELRIQSGLTYHANTYFEARRLPGAFAMYFYTANETGMRAAKMALDVLDRFRAAGITTEQLQSAKAYIKGQFGPTLQTNDELADIMCDLHFYGLGPDYINTYLDKVDAVTMDDARRVIEKFFPSKDLRFVIIGQGQVIGPIGQAIAGDTIKLSITDTGF